MWFSSIFLVKLINCSIPPRGHTLGQPWPMPQMFKQTEDIQVLSKTHFHFNVQGNDCELLRAAFDRYFKIIFYEGDEDTAMRLKRKFSRLQEHNKLLETSELTVLIVDVFGTCEEIPHMKMDETYQLNIAKNTGELRSASVWGALRGLETFSQLVYQDDIGRLLVNNTMIKDAPRFSHRGVLLDTSRHYLPVPIIKENLEAMAYNKFNVFHWHIVDDPSFPYESRDFPAMSQMGAYDPYTHVYTQEDVKNIIEFARIRGIRVVPEFDSPGHSQSWGKGVPGLLTPCYTKAGKPTGGYGPMNPILESTYKFLTAFMKEVTEVFQDHYVHLGGDEVSFGCWQSNPNITEFMNKTGLGKDYAKLESLYIQKLLNIVGSYNHGYIIWQEVFDNKNKIRPDTMVHVWRAGWQKELARVTSAGYNALLSAPWYLDYIRTGADWHTYYMAEPLAFNGTKEEKSRVLGGEACLWGEWVDGANVVSRLWPRASAVAERLWSAQSENSTSAAEGRMEEHRCRLVKRGINAEPPSGPNYCNYEAGTRNSIFW